MSSSQRVVIEESPAARAAQLDRQARARRRARARRAVHRRRQLVLSMVLCLVSFAAYDWLMGWWFAAGVVVLLYVHEMGHLFVFRRLRLAASPPLLIPLLGALVVAEEEPGSAHDEAWIALGGPVLGGAAALGALGLALVTRQVHWQVLAVLGLTLNLFNLIPFPPLDGGRIVTAIHPLLWIGGLLTLVVLAFGSMTLFLSVLIVVGLLEVGARWPTLHRGHHLHRQQTPTGSRVLLGIAYLATSGIMAAALAWAWSIRL